MYDLMKYEKTSKDWLGKSSYYQEKGKNGISSNGVLQGRS